MGCVEGSRACRGTGQSCMEPQPQTVVLCLDGYPVSLSGRLQLHPFQPKVLYGCREMASVACGSGGLCRISVLIMWLLLVLHYRFITHHSLLVSLLYQLKWNVETTSSTFSHLYLTVLNISSKCISVFCFKHHLENSKGNIEFISIFSLSSVLLLLEVPSVLLLVVVMLFLQEWITPLIYNDFYFMLFYLKNFLPHHMPWGIFVPWPGIELGSESVESYHCITRELPSFIISFLCRELPLAIHADDKFSVFYLRMPSFPFLLEGSFCWI